MTANDKGRYVVLLPYANRGYTSAVRADPNYTLYCQSEQAELIIDESAVVDGSIVKGPDLCLGASR